MDYEKDFEESFEGTSFGTIYCKHHRGEGKTIIFLHGFSATLKVWSAISSGVSA